jgi:hypothetical protein
MAQRRQAWVKLLQDAGYTPRFISSEQIERGEFKEVRVLVLPDSVALSEGECDGINAFLKTYGKIVTGNGGSGVFDSHGRWQLERPGFELDSNRTWTIWGVSSRIRADGGGSVGGGFDDWDIGEYVGDRTKPPLASRYPKHVRSIRDQVPLTVRLRPTSETAKVWPPAENIELPGDPPSATHDLGLAVRTHRYKLGAARLLAFERNIVWQMGEDLKQRGGNEALEKPVTFEATLAAPGYVYELRTGRALGRVEKFQVVLDPWQPALYAVTPEPIEGDVVAKLSAHPR